jgi:adenine-specific DNA-methyltransferase
MARKRLLDIYNSNDVINRKNKYKKNCDPFKILYLNPSKIKNVISGEFLTKIKKDSDNNGDIENPKFNINIDFQHNKAKIELKNYDIPYLNLIAENIKKQVMNWTDWIDYWSIDFDYHKNIFNNMWVSYRTPKKRELQLNSESYLYTDSGTHYIQVKVIDILGTETIQTYKIDIK